MYVRALLRARHPTQNMCHGALQEGTVESNELGRAPQQAAAAPTARQSAVRRIEAETHAVTDLQVAQAAGPRQALRLLARRDGGLDLRLNLS